MELFDAIFFSVQGFIGFAFFGCLAFLLPLQNFFFSVVALVILDTVSALWAVRKNSTSLLNFYSKLESKKFYRLVEKIVFYCLMGISLYIVGYGIGEGDMMKKAALIVVGSIELKSNIENIEKITGKSIWSLVIDQLKSIFISNQNQNPL